MNCPTHEPELVDLARGIRLDTVTEAGLREHLGQCPSCARRFAHEQELSAALRELPPAVPASATSAALEERLLQAFAARKALPVQRRRDAGYRWWLTAAALVVLSAGAWMGSRPWRSAQPDTPAIALAPGAPAHSAPGSVFASSDAAQSPSTMVQARRVLRPQPPASRRDAPVPRVPAGDDGVLQFVTLPFAAGLPDIESGRIVRVELSMASLPAFGIDIPPEDADRVVTADVLVGQDGQPRAIRFVGLESDSRRRQ